MRRFVSLVLVLLLALTLTGSLALRLPGSQPAKADVEAKNIIIIIWDGTQRAHLLEMLARHELPNLQRLIDETHTLVLPVIDSQTCEPGSGDGYRPQTGPANSAIATGLGYPEMANQHNSHPHPIPDGLTLWEWFEERTEEGYVTALMSLKAHDFWPYVPLKNALPDIDYKFISGSAGAGGLTQELLAFVSTHASSDFFAWVHYWGPDVWGHKFGENSPEYTAILQKQDVQLGQILDHLSVLGLKEDTIIILTTDHGFEEDGDDHYKCIGDNTDVWLAVTANGKDLLGCVHKQTDVAPCLKNLLFP